MARAGAAATRGALGSLDRRVLTRKNAILTHIF
jgi:hypothetical protein